MAYQKPKGKRELKFKEEQDILRRSIRDIVILLKVLMWASIVLMAIAFGIFIRLLLS